MKSKMSVLFVFFILLFSFVSAKESSPNFIRIDGKSFCFGNSCLWGSIDRAIEKQEPKICYRLIGEKREQKCLLEVSSEITTPGKCEDIKEENYKNSCYISVAKFTKDIDYCYKIANGGDRRPCFSAIAVITLNESLCEDYSCLTTLAELKQDSNICKIKKDSIEDDYGSYLDDLRENYNTDVTTIRSPVDLCLESYAVQLKDEQVCFTLSDNDNKNSCFREVAIGNNDITICKYIQNVSGPVSTSCTIINGERTCEEVKGFFDNTDDYKILNCYSLIIDNDGSTSQCEKVREDSVKLMDACYNIYKIRSGNYHPNLPEGIPEPDWDN